MSRETRWNLIFLVILLVALAPGAVILFRKKLDPNAKPMYLPDPMPHQATYNDYAQQNPRLARIVPPLTADWLQEVARQHSPSSSSPSAAVSAPSGHPGHPRQISSRRAYEILRADRISSEALRLSLISWNPFLTTQSSAASFTLAGQPLQLAQFESIPVPRPVRLELQSLGFVNPPPTVGYFELIASPPPSVSPAAVLTVSLPPAWQDTCALPPATLP